jgi:hypothetical protein
MTHNQSDRSSDALVINAVLDGCGNAFEALGGEADGFGFCVGEFLGKNAREEEYGCEQGSSENAGTNFGAAQENLLEIWR